MKKGTRKALIITSTVIATGGIATSIIVPVLAIVFNTSLNYDPNKDLYDKIVGKDVEKDLEKQGQKDQLQLNKFDYQVVFYLYQFEQKGSLELQKEHFYWNIHDLENKIKEERDKDEEQEKIEERIKKLQEDINKINDRLEKLNNEIKDGNSLNYDEDDFASNYSKVLLPLEKVREKRTKVFNDSKENYVSKYDTRQNGLNTWPEERRKLYNDAATDEEAIDYLTQKEISPNSFGQFKFKLDSDYTYEQKYAKRDGQFIFSFLRTAIEKKYENDPSDFNPEEAEKARKEEKVYFLASDSRIPQKFNVNLEDQNSPEGMILKEILKQNLIKVNHALIAAKQNTNGAFNAWTFEKEKNVMRNLLTFFGNSNRQVLDLIPNLFASNDDATQQEKIVQDTSIFIDFYSNDTSGQKKYGSLGIKTVIDYVKEMVPGFSFGILAILNNKTLPENDERNNQNFLQNLSTNLKNATKTAWSDKVPTTDGEVEQALNNLNDEDTTRIFGGAFRDTFDPSNQKDGLKLYYPAGKDANVVISSNGVHAIKITTFDDVDKIKNEIDQDLTKVANEQDINKAETNWSTLFNNYFSQEFRTDFIIRAYNKNDELKNYILEKDKDIIWEDVLRLIGSLKNSRVIESANKALDKKVQEFYIDAINKQLREIDVALKPEEIYNLVFEKALIKE